MTRNLQVIPRENAQLTQTNGDIDVFKLGRVFAASGYFQDAKDEAQAIVKIIAGKELGIGAMASMTGFHIVKGKPVLSANLIASIIKNKYSPYNYRVLELTDTACEIEFFERNESIGKSRFTIEEAKTAGLTGKDVWKNFPKNMLFARAISNGAKWYCPDVFNGATVYVPEELGAEVDGDGEIIRVPVNDTPNPPERREPVQVLTAEEAETVAARDSSLRTEIIALSEVLGKDSAPTLRFFDANPNRRAQCHDKVLTAARDAVKTAITSEDWAYTSVGTAEFLAELGITGIETATAKSLFLCLKELADLGMA